MNKKLGCFGLIAVTCAGLFIPAPVSAQERCYGHRYYAPAPIIYRDRCWRERQIIREREWRDRHHGDRYYGYR